MLASVPADLAEYRVAELKGLGYGRAAIIARTPHDGKPEHQGITWQGLFQQPQVIPVHPMLTVQRRPNWQNRLP